MRLEASPMSASDSSEGIVTTAGGQILSRPMRYAVLLEHREASPRSSAAASASAKDVDPGDHQQYIRRPGASLTPNGPFKVSNAEGFALESVESLWLCGDGSRRRCLV